MANTIYMALEQSIEASLKAWLGSATHGISLTGYSIRVADQDDSDHMTLPAITIRATREAEDPAPSSGCFRCNVEVAMLTQANDTTTAQVETDWHNLVYILMWDDLAARLSDYSGLKVYGVVREGGTIREVTDLTWRNVFSFTVWAISQD